MKIYGSVKSIVNFSAINRLFGCSHMRGWIKGYKFGDAMEILERKLLEAEQEIKEL